MFKPVQFGKYYLTERIAVGGMAEIFKAKLYGVSGFEKPMVVKQILPQYARNAEFIKMFIDEAKIAVSLTHGNIIPVYELGRIDGVYFIAMEYVHGKNLGEILESARDRRMQLSIDDAVYIAIETCKGLDYAHRRTDAQGSSLGLVHRDISPPNVMVSMTGEVKLADFGIAKATHKLGNTEAGVVKGTYGYMSPEQLLGDVVDHRTDIFSCGILLYEMLTGRRLFGGGSELEAMERVKEARVQAPSTMSSRVPSALDPIVARALAKDPADRYATANEFQLELSRFLFSSGAGASATTLTGFINRLFPSNEAANEPLMPEEPPPPNPAVSNRTQSYAVRDVLEEVDRQQQHQPQRTAGAGLASDRTMGLPALAPAEGLAPLDIESEAFDELAEDEKTNVFRRDEPQKPEVPELRFSAPAAGRGKQPAGGL
ncbi:MAG: serine/threonine protein kinase, partial [Myxococcales bacterium]|nr:serine/threonine protein kinase [Myxococcales bacterium]